MGGVPNKVRVGAGGALSSSHRVGGAPNKVRELLVRPRSEPALITPQMLPNAMRAEDLATIFATCDSMMCV